MLSREGLATETQGGHQAGEAHGGHRRGSGWGAWDGQRESGKGV